MEEIDKLSGIYKNGYGYVAKSIMKNRNISIKAKAVYAYLASYAGKKSTAYPPIKLMCQDLRVTPSSLNKYINELVNCGLISKTKNRSDDMRFENNLYTINQDAIIDEPSYKIFTMENMVDEKNIDGKNHRRKNRRRKNIY